MAPSPRPWRDGGRPGGLATTSKILLAAIALGLWANAAVSYVRPARAEIGSVAGELVAIGDVLGLIEIALSRPPLKADCPRP